MKLYRITACDYAKDLSGEGAFLYGGRWNSKGTRLLYTAENPALAYLEALAHMTMVNQQRAYCKMTLDFNLPSFLPAKKEGKNAEPGSCFLEMLPNMLPVPWRALPPPSELKKIGDDFVKEGKYVALKIPSVVEPDCFNFLFNPAHSLFKNLALIQQVRISLDQRLI